MHVLLLALCFLLLRPSLFSLESAFNVVVLGCHGGPIDANLSGYLIAPKGSSTYIALDAGTLLEGIRIAYKKNSFHEISLNPQSSLWPEADILQNFVKAYLISHAHLDHIAGLVMNSPADSKKTIYGIKPTIRYLKEYIFNGAIWPNFASEGNKPRLDQYEYQRLQIEEQVAVFNTPFHVEPFLLNHPHDYPSTAFLLEASDHYVLYVGDTSPDALESSKRLAKVWKKIAPLIQQNKLHAIFLECSYPNEQPANTLFGHLDPHYMIEELSQLARYVDPLHPEVALKNIKVIVTHIKKSIFQEKSAEETIRKELEKLNTLHLSFIFPEQGEKLQL